MATPGDLAPRVLRKLRVVGLYDIGEAEETQAAIQAIHDAHAMLQTQGLLRWTLQDIPTAVEAAYVMLAADMGAADFVVPREPDWRPAGLALVQAYVNVPVTQRTCAVDF